MSISAPDSNLKSTDDIIGGEVFPTKQAKNKSKQKQKIPEPEPKKDSSESNPDDDIDPKLKKIIENSTADMWNRLRKTWTVYVDTVTKDNLKQNLESSEQHEITLQKSYLENSIEKYLDDLELGTTVFRKSPVLINNKDDKIA